MSALGDWVSRLSRVDLPVLRATSTELERLRAAEDQVTARELATVMLRDPLMAVKVLRFSQSRLTSRQPTEVTTVEHAIMMHGVSPFFREFRQLIALEDALASNPEALNGALQVISRSYHASVNARSFSAVRHDMEGEEVMVSALLHDLAELLVWCTEPAIALQIERMVASNKGLRSAAAQRAVLGFPLTDLQIALAREWKLPGLLTTLMDDKQWENPRVQTVRVSVSIARHSAHGWQDAGLPDDYKTLNGLLNLPPDQARKWVRQSALQAARRWRDVGVRPAAAWLPALPGDLSVGAVQREAFDPTRGTRVVDTVVKQLLEKIGPGVERNAVIALALYGLESGLGVRRMCVLTLNPKLQRMEPGQHVFHDAGLSPADLGFDLGSGHLFERLLERGQALRHDPEHTARLLPLLPADLRAKIGHTGFYAMALRPEKRPAALVYADVAASDGGMSEAGYNAFKRICVALGLALARAAD